MGTIIKNISSSSANNSDYPHLTLKQGIVHELQQGTVIPTELFEQTLAKVETLISNQNYDLALPELLNLEVTDFNNIRVHELLSEIYLAKGELVLAKEQCTLCSSLVAEKYGSNEFVLENSFEQLVTKAGNKTELQTQYSALMQEDHNIDHLFNGTKTALNLAIHYMAEHRYQEAEQLLIAYRERYLSLLTD